VDERAPSMGAKSLCIPFDQAQFPSIEGRKCPQCGVDAKRWTMFGRCVQCPPPSRLLSCSRFSHSQELLIWPRGAAHMRERGSAGT
jgi:hypothetical protein